MRFIKIFLIVVKISLTMRNFSVFTRTEKSSAQEILVPRKVPIHVPFHRELMFLDPFRHASSSRGTCPLFFKNRFRVQKKGSAQVLFHREKAVPQNIENQEKSELYAEPFFSAFLSFLALQLLRNVLVWNSDYAS